MEHHLPPAENVIELIPSGVSLDILRDKGFLPVSLEGSVLTLALSNYTSAAEAQLLAAAMQGRELESFCLRYRFAP